MSITTFFHHKTIRRIVLAFGTLFNGYYVEKDDGTKVKVPITWSAKARWYTILKQEKLNKEQLQGIVLPRMGFYITEFMYDPARKTPTLNRQTRHNPDDPNQVKYVYSCTPYNIGFAVNIITKTVDEGLQILEQIIPYFTPNFSVTITELDELANKKDLQISLNSVRSDFVKEGTFDGSDVYIWDMAFTVEASLYKNISSAAIIKQVIVDTHPTANPSADAIKVRQTVAVDPETAYIDDEYTILETLGIVAFDEPKLPPIEP